MPLKPDQQLAVTLTAQEWNLVMAELARGKFNRVANVIINIQNQCQKYDQDAAPTAPVSRLHPVPDNEDRTA